MALFEDGIEELKGYASSTGTVNFTTDVSFGREIVRSAAILFGNGVT